METIKTNQKCKTVRGWLYKAISKHVGLDIDWVQNHIAKCPKCQRRLASIGKVTLALSIIKSQRHNLDLLMRANAKAIGVLGRSLRNSPKAEKLKRILPEPKLPERLGKYKSSVTNMAACIAVLFVMKITVFLSMEQFQSESRKIVKQYYTDHVGSDLADELFSA